MVIGAHSGPVSASSASSLPNSGVGLASGVPGAIGLNFDALDLAVLELEPVAGRPFPPPLPVARGDDPETLGVPRFWFNRTDGQKVTKSIEGFLFPDTYEFQPQATATQMLETMVEHFMKVSKQLDFVNKAQEQRNISPYEVLTVASLSQAEAGNADDLGKISRVAYNRLYGSTPMPLEYDVGINYYYQLTGKPTKPSSKMTDAELQDPKNPYRLHGKNGLTPTPINNPGRAALEGALNPPKGNWLFFVAIDKQGHSAFAATNAEHERNIAIAKKNGVL